MISTSAVVFAQYPQVAIPRLAARFSSRFESVRTAHGQYVVHIPAVGAVLMGSNESSLTFSFVARDASAHFAARTTLDAMLRRELEGTVFTIGWEESDTVPVPLRA